MDYNKIRKKLNKYAEGGKMIPKYQFGGAGPQPQVPGRIKGERSGGWTWTGFAWTPTNVYEAQERLNRGEKAFGENNITGTEDDEEIDNGFDEDEYTVNGAADQSKEEDHRRFNATDTVQLSQQQNQALDDTNAAFGAMGFNSVYTTAQQYKKDKDGNVVYDKDGNPVKEGLSEGGQMAMGIAAQGISKALNVADDMTMGDKNFSAQSQALDSAVHGVSGALMKSGNPYAMAAGAALEGLNFVTKAGGRTVPGYDVNINNSGYGNLGHQESSSGRIWDDWTGKTGRKLAKRNEQARMAIAAADISEDQAYQQEARANSVTNVLEANQIALAGGIDTSLLGN